MSTRPTSSDPTSSFKSIASTHCRRLACPLLSFHRGASCAARVCTRNLKGAPAMKSVQKGFTLIELMIVVAVIAIPAYQDYTVRSKVTEGLNLGSSAEVAVADGFQSNDIAGVATASAQWAAEFAPTKYVAAIAINAVTGVITVTYGPATPQINGATILLTPSINKVALATGQSGNIDWACGSATTTTATAEGLPVNAGTVLARYAPTQCK